jgi:hypothetical protein
MASQLINAKRENPYWGEIRYLLGVVLLVASGFKMYGLIHPGATTEAWASGRWPIGAAILSEFLIGAWLLVMDGRRWTWILLVATWLVFTCVAALHVVIGSSSCGCFGNAKVNPWLTFIADATTLSVLLYIRRGVWAMSLKRPSTIALASFTSLSLVAFVAITAGIYAMELRTQVTAPGVTASNGMVMVAPNNWVGIQCPVRSYILNGEMLDHGDWYVLFYRTDCGECRKALPVFESAARRANVALVEVPPFGYPKEAIGALGEARHLRLDDSYAWIISTPLSMTMRDGKVLKVFNAENIGDGLPR